VKKLAERPQGINYFEFLFSVIPSNARRESFRKDSGQAGMTAIWTCGRDHRWNNHKHKLPTQTEKT